MEEGKGGVGGVFFGLPDLLFCSKTLLKKDGPAETTRPNVARMAHRNCAARNHHCYAPFFVFCHWDEKSLITKSGTKQIVRKRDSIDTHRTAHPENFTKRRLFW